MRIWMSRRRRNCILGCSHDTSTSNIVIPHLTPNILTSPSFLSSFYPPALIRLFHFHRVLDKRCFDYIMLVWLLLVVVDGAFFFFLLIGEFDYVFARLSFSLPAFFLVLVLFFLISRASFAVKIPLPSFCFNRCHRHSRRWYARMVAELEHSSTKRSFHIYCVC